LVPSASVAWPGHRGDRLRVQRRRPRRPRPGASARGAPARVAFAAAFAVLFGLAIGLLWRRTSVWPLVGSALLLGTLIVGYALSRTSGIAPLGAEREPLDALGLATKVVELVGVVVAASCVPARSGRPRTSDRADVRPASPASLIRPEENPTYEEVR
jgi:hypothetical protein